MKKFVSTMRKGFHITFENGLEASVQWGAGNYCDNRFPKDNSLHPFDRDAESNTAEVAVFGTNGDLWILSRSCPKIAVLMELLQAGSLLSRSLTS